MGLVTVDNAEISAISISQNPGMLAPAINAKILPNLADVTDSSYLAYSAPDLTISIGGVTYVCAPDETSVNIDPDSLGVDIEVQYYPKSLRSLRHGGMKKTLVFVSCRPYQREILEGEYDEDLNEVLFKDCDVYVSNGWTIQEIIAEIAARVGLSISVLVPTLHVPQATVTLQRGQKFLDFIRGLLPQGFEYAWSINGDSLTIALIQGSSGGNIGFIPGTYRTSVSSQALPSYDFIEITGSPYKYGHVIDLGVATQRGGSTVWTDGKTVTEILPDETTDTEDGTQTTSVTHTYRTGPDGTGKFAIDERETIVTGPYPSSYGTPTIQEIRKTVETFTYENDDVMVYIQPRKIQVHAETQQFYTVLSGSQVLFAQAYYLTDDGKVLTPTEFLAIPEIDRPGFLLAAYQTYGDAEVYDEAYTYITEATADTQWYEGMQRDNSVIVSHRFCLINDLYYDSLLPPKELLQSALSDMSTSQDTLAVDTYASDIWKEGQVTTRTITLISDGSYQFEESVRLFDTKAGGMIAQPAKRQVIDSGGVPSSPSKYRTDPLNVTLDTVDGGNPRSNNNGLGASGDVCFPLSLTIPTSNPNDFEVWAGMLMEQVLSPPRMVSASSFDVLYPPGSIVNGVTIASFQVTDSEDGHAVVMGGIG